MSYIEREPLLKKAKEVLGDAFGTPLIARMIEEAPAVDVVEVVRCKDCQCAKEMNEHEKHIYPTATKMCRRALGDKPVMDYNYCYWARRRTNRCISK